MPHGARSTTGDSRGRRRALAALGALALGGCAGWNYRPPERGPVAAMFPGRIDDGGFMEVGYRGLERARDEFGIPVRHVAGVPPDREPMLAALRELAASDATLVAGYGPETSEAIQRVAWEFPQQRFVAIEGRLTRPNLAVYGVRQEESAWLAGAAAGLLTQSNAVGHLAGARTERALAARAAFAAGLRTANPAARFLTRFAGTDDDSALARRLTLAAIDAGADLMFTPLGAGRSGAAEACRERRVRQIGSVRDWVAVAPEEYIASAVADSGYALVMAVRDLRDNMLKGDLVKRYGVRYPEAVRLSLADAVSPQVRAAVEGYRDSIAAGAIRIPGAYTGPEFAARAVRSD
jgi:basic membrane protein A